MSDFITMMFQDFAASRPSLILSTSIPLQVASWINTDITSLMGSIPYLDKDMPSARENSGYCLYIGSFAKPITEDFQDSGDCPPLGKPTPHQP